MALRCGSHFLGSPLGFRILRPHSPYKRDDRLFFVPYANGIRISIAVDAHKMENLHSYELMKGPQHVTHPC